MALFTSAQVVASAQPADDPIRAGYQIFYSGNFSGAYSHFHNLMERDPENLAAAYGIIATLYQQDMNDASVRKEFEKRAEEFIEKAEKRYDGKPRDTEAHFYLAQVHGIRAAYRFQRRKSLWGAARDAAKSKHYSEEFVRQHPDRADAYIALGLYNYYVDISPSFVKVLRILLFLPGGSRTEGLKQLEHAARAGEVWAPQAKLELIRIYGWLEGRVAEALNLAEELQETFPENPELRFRLARLYAGPMLEQYRLAADQYSTIVARHEQGHPHYEDGDRYSALLELARVRNRQARVEEAVAALTPAIAEGVEEPEWVMPQFLLRRADYRALLDDPRAAEDARRVLARREWKSWHGGARQVARRIERQRASGEARVYAQLLPGNRLVVDQRWDEAAEFFEEMRGKHPGDWQVKYRLAWLDFSRGRMDRAEPALRNILAGRSKEMPGWVRANAMLYLARIHDLRQEREQALQLYEDIVDDYEKQSAAASARLGLVTPYRRFQAEGR